MPASTTRSTTTSTTTSMVTSPLLSTPSAGALARAVQGPPKMMAAGAQVLMLEGVTPQGSLTEAVADALTEDDWRFHVARIVYNGLPYRGVVVDRSDLYPGLWSTWVATTGLETRWLLTQSHPDEQAQQTFRDGLVRDALTALTSEDPREATPPRWLSELVDIPDTAGGYDQALRAAAMHQWWDDRIAEGTPPATAQMMQALSPLY